MNRTYKQGVSILEQSVDEYSRAFDSLQASVQNSGHAHVSRIENNDGKDGGWNPGAAWYGGFTKTTDATDLMRHGWKDGADRLNDLRQELGEVPTAKTRKRQPRWADDGHTLDVDRALAGQWDIAYRDSRRVWAAGPQVIELVGAFGGNAVQDADALFWNGAASIVLADILENAGYSVRMVSQFATETKGNTTVVRVVTKDAGEAMRPDAVASVACHAGTFRTLGFQSILSTPYNVGLSLGGYVAPRSAERRMAAIGEWQEGALTVPEAYTRRDAINAIRETLKAVQGGSSEAA